MPQRVERPLPEPGAGRSFWNWWVTVLALSGLPRRVVNTKSDASHSGPAAGRPILPRKDVERVQRTILEVCWKPAFARAFVPKSTAPRLDLRWCRQHDRTERAHTGRWTAGRTPDEMLGKAGI